MCIEDKSGGKPDVMTCVLPKSVLDKLDEWALVQPVPYTGGLTNMVATGPLKHAASFGPTIKVDAKNVNEDHKPIDGSQEIKPVSIMSVDTVQSSCF